MAQLVNAFGSSSFSKQKQIGGVTKSEANETYVNVIGDQMEGLLNMKNNPIKNLALPTDKNDAVSKKYCDDSKHKMNQNLDMSKHKIINLEDPQGNNDAMNLGYFTSYYYTLHRKMKSNYNDLKNNNNDLKKEMEWKIIEAKENITTNNEKNISNLKEETNSRINDFDDIISNIESDIQKTNTSFSNLEEKTKTEIENSAKFIAAFHQTKFLALDGTNKPTNAIDFNNQKIANVKYPEFKYDAASKIYVDQKIDKILTSLSGNFSPISGLNPRAVGVICKSISFWDKNRGSKKGWTMIDVGFTTPFDGKITQMILRSKEFHENIARIHLIVDGVDKNDYFVELQTNEKLKIMNFTPPLFIVAGCEIKFSHSEILKPGTVCQILFESHEEEPELDRELEH